MATKRASKTKIQAVGEQPLTDRQALHLSVLIPVYNERHYVEASVRRVLALKHPLIASLEVIAVDDCSTDGSYEVLERIAAEDDRLTLVRHSNNQGKGGALRTALPHASGDVTVCHDADLEYDPEDIPALLLPFLREGADAVFGSRYLSAAYRRVHMHRHTLVNRTLTELSNWITDLNLTDLETCYKVVRTPLLQSIPLRSDDFRIEVELAFKLVKRRARIFEAPIRYMPRTFQEGKKIRMKDGLLALWAMGRFALIDDAYQEDEYGSNILVEMERARRFNLWMGDALRPHIGDKVLEIGAGIGTLTSQFIPREKYVASDVNPHYLRYLNSYAIGKPYLKIRRVDVTCDEHFEGLEGQFDTVVIVNVLEHVADEHKALKHLYDALEPGGRVVVLVPQHEWLYGTLDEALDHRERYTEAHLRESLQGAGFEIGEIFDFNRFSVPGWWLNGRVLKKKTFSRVQLKVLDTLMPAFKRIDRALPWKGQSVIGVGVKPA